MKEFRFRLLGILVGLLLWTTVHAQKSNCTNLGFEMGDFTNWVGYNWVYSTDVPSANTTEQAVSLPTSRRQVIMDDTSALDANTGYALKKVPPGYLYSARLGDEIIAGTDLNNFRCWQQSLRYTMTIDSTNALLIMKFALVLQYAADHSTEKEPRFRLTLFDQNGETIPDCANYDVFASNGSVKGFHLYNAPGFRTPVEWRDWTTVGANLLKYIGQTITIEFMSADCTKRFHYGYVYFVAECHPLYISVQYCSGDSVARLTAPEGFEKYSWTNNSGMVVDSVQILKITDPVEGAVFNCTMTSATGCTVVLKSTIIKYVVKTDFTSSMIDCKSNKVQFTNLSTTNRGTLYYKWDFGDGNTSSEENPLHTFATSGLHQVSLELSNPPSTCGEKLTKTIESFSPPLVGIQGDSTYCPGLSFYWKAYGAFNYTWSNGSTADSIKVGSPGGKFWLLGHSSTGCVSDTIYKTLTKEPDWKFISLSDSTLCKGESSILKYSGAVKYLWNTQDTTSSIVVTTPGIYTIIGTNTRGCRQTKSVHVVEYPLPMANFTTSAATLDTRHNQIACSLAGQTDVQYIWDMGDGLSETGSTIDHTYTVLNSVFDYTISLTATSVYGCISRSSKQLEVIPFIPNVFSPNGDGINDIFMPQVDLQIFDRYGKILYNGNTGWDGNYQGRLVDPDTYFYLIHYKDRSQQLLIKKGSLTLLR